MSGGWDEHKVSADELLRHQEQQEGELLFVPESPGDEEADEIGRKAFQPGIRTRKRKRPRRTESKLPATKAPMNSLLQSPIVSQPARSRPPVRIKSEAESQALADLRSKPPDEKVIIYVGSNNATYEVGLDDLEKSPVLKALVNTTGAQTPFIMHPQLTEISANHFDSIYEFLLPQEYMPGLVDNLPGQNILPKRLDGCTSPGHYQNEALRGAHLYVIAKSLGMKSMQDLVFRKITQAQHYPYGIECLLGVAMIVFSRAEAQTVLATFNSERLGNNQNDEGDQDILEEWLVRTLGDKLQPMMINHAQLFFQVANHGACAARRFGVRVLRRKVEFWDTMGVDVIAIEDDE
ncbi:hypothetical protein PV04_07721 [Phialophora macrospora]|uniref:BTB domain-containing protein n=1 Tax=Phialophora macrospora TaxID=1851006 RepID=A0A0D2FBU1_9EURO|nr:hypothetical protein PV04_07721 [Phialophora macrospora]